MEFRSTAILIHITDAYWPKTKWKAAFLPDLLPSIVCWNIFFSSYRLCAMVWGASIGWLTWYWKLIYWILLFFRRHIYLFKAISYPVLQRVRHRHSFGISTHQLVGLLFSSANSFTNIISLLVPTIFLWINTIVKLPCMLQLADVVAH